MFSSTNTATTFRFTASRRSSRGRASRSAAPRWPTGSAGALRRCSRSSTGCAWMHLHDHGCSSTKPPSRCWHRGPARPKPATCGSSSVTTGPMAVPIRRWRSTPICPAAGPCGPDSCWEPTTASCRSMPGKPTTSSARMTAPMLAPGNPTAGRTCDVSLSMRAVTLRSRRMRCSASLGSTESKRTSVVARPRNALRYGRSEAVR